MSHVSIRSLIPRACILGLALSGVACSSKPAEPDTAESVVPDPVIKPAPAPAPTPAPAAPASPAPTEPKP